MVIHRKKKNNSVMKIFLKLALLAQCYQCANHHQVEQGHQPLSLSQAIKDLFVSLGALSPSSYSDTSVASARDGISSLLKTNPALTSRLSFKSLESTNFYYNFDKIFTKTSGFPEDCVILDITVRYPIIIHPEFNYRVTVQPADFDIKRFNLLPKDENRPAISQAEYEIEMMGDLVVVAL